MQNVENALPGFAPLDDVNDETSYGPAWSPVLKYPSAVIYNDPVPIMVAKAVLQASNAALPTTPQNNFEFILISLTLFVVTN